ncbi:hypothetical protein NKH18_17365 [Streptomyces sp. M10(2022)]
MTSTTAQPGRIPARWSWAGTRRFGWCVRRVRAGRADAGLGGREVGAAPDSTAYQELNAFFSSMSFQRQSRAMSSGRVSTEPLFADDDDRTPLGVFVVDVVPGTATLITQTPKAELRDINTSTIRNERSLQKTAAFGIDGVVGPAFNFFDLGKGR